VSTPSWTELKDVVSLLRKRWDRGLYVGAFCGATTWQPVPVPLRCPTAADVLHRFDDVRRWSDKWHREVSRGLNGPRIEYRALKSRSVGENRVPSKVWVDTPDQLCELIGTSSQRRSLEEVLEMTCSFCPELVAWVREHPLAAIANHGLWAKALATVRWMAEHDTAQLYLRQLDVGGVDTKFVERNAKLLEQLLAVLAPQRVRPSTPDIALRLGFRPKPDYVRLRFLGPQPTWPPGVSEVRLRADELPGAGIRASTVFIVENEISYLAFPLVVDSIVTFGSGYALEPARTGAWLEARRVVYWGDIDTHGFAILNNLRQQYSHVVSVLMDRATLLAHSSQWVREDLPISRPLPHLNSAEAELYRDLVEDCYGPSVRLEQERIRFSFVDKAALG
jgi:hypothetical protein